MRCGTMVPAAEDGDIFVALRRHPDEVHAFKSTAQAYHAPSACISLQGFEAVRAEGHYKAVRRNLRV